MMRGLYAALLLTLLAFILCFVPLFNVLSYEFSLAMTVACGLLMPFVGQHLALSSSENLWPRALLSVVLILSLPLAVISLNALRVRNCNYLTGLHFYFLLPVISAIYATLFGILTARFFPHKPWLRFVSIIGLQLLHLGLCFWRFYSQAPIFIFDHLWGYFPGSLYDEHIGIDARLLVFRFSTFIHIILLFSLLSFLHKKITFEKLLGAGFTLIVLFCLDTFVGPSIGYQIKTKDIDKALSSVETAPSLVMHFSPRIPKETRKLLAREHQFRLQELERILQVKIPFTIHSYIYASKEQKAFFMGASKTMFVKPWRHEIHLHPSDSINLLIAHEMVHAVAASFADNLLGLSANYGIFVNMGVVEGLADALSPDRQALSSDHFARALQLQQQLPNLSKLLLGTHFWHKAPESAYPLVGSFIKYLLKIYGPEPLKKMYAKADFEKAYKLPLTTLISNYQQALTQIMLFPNEEKIATKVQRTPSIFAKPCAHEIAALREQIQQEPLEQAIVLQQQLCGYLNTEDARLDLIQLFMQAQNYPQALQILQEIPNDTERLVFESQIYWQQQQYPKAEELLQTALRQETELNKQRLYFIRLWMMQNHLNTLYDYTLGNMEKAAAIAELIPLYQNAPKDKTFAYLIGRILVQSQSYQTALNYLDQAENHPFKPIEIERLQLKAQALEQLKKYQEAKTMYLNYANIVTSSGEQERAFDNATRMEFYLKQGEP